MSRLTHKRNNGIKEGYWSPNKKEELVQRLAEYEDTGLDPEQVQQLKERDTAKKPKKYGVTDSQGVFYPLVGVDGVPYDLCPNCDSNLCTTGMFGRSKERMKYCEKCGQRLDWSE